ncbi:hypothetical protein [Demequina globuliformis]|uniref:hypothetical protein n=1 Tax=Demequina globuliformis TaxID=676202 RepID=UPI000780294F|nr:hypothetical protein [Demequina globuliformis]
MTGHEGDTPISVHGGYAGTHAVTADLETASGVVSDAAHSIEECWRQLRQAQHQIDDQIPQAGPEVRAWVVRVRDVIDDALSISAPGSALVGALDSCGSDLLRVAQGYEDAERAARQGISLFETAGRYGHDILSMGVSATRAVWATTWRWTLPGQVAHNRGFDPIGGALMPNSLPPMTGVFNRGSVTFVTGLLDERSPLGPPTGPTPYQSIAGMLAGVGAGLEWLMGEPAIAGVKAQPSRAAVAAPRDLEGIYANVDSAAEGHLAIDKVIGPDGEVSYIVNIPGTADHGYSDADPRDWPANAEGAMGSADGEPVMTDYSEAVLMAMEDAGIPPDAPVMLVGHSQGATVAYGLAASPLVQSKYSITHVVTAGSPADDQPRNPNVKSLTVQDASDLVPGVDGDRGTRGVNEVLITTDARASSDPETAAAARGIVSAHEMPQYTRLARDIDALGHPSVEHYKATAGMFLSGAAVERTVYTAQPAGESAPQEPSRPQRRGEAVTGPRGPLSMPVISEQTRERALEYFNANGFPAPPVLERLPTLGGQLGTVAPLPGGRD